jgi:hypothetical protein
VPTIGATVCADPRCATLLDDHAERCDECGGTRLFQIAAEQSLLCGWADDRPVVFRLPTSGAAVIGRSAPGEAAPDIDLSRFPNSQSVHRRHAQIEARERGWQLTHLGSNPLRIGGQQRIEVAPGTTALARPGDTIDAAGVRLHLVARPRAVTS